MDETLPAVSCETCQHHITSVSGLSKAEWQEAIHSQRHCLSCILAKVFQTDLCNLCRHIGVRHLIFCSQLFKPGPLMSPNRLHLSLGSWEDLKSRKGCPLCQAYMYSAVIALSRANPLFPVPRMESPGPSVSLLLDLHNQNREIPQAPAYVYKTPSVGLNQTREQEPHSLSPEVRPRQITIMGNHGLMQNLLASMRRMFWWPSQDPGLRCDSLEPLISWERMKEALDICVSTHDACSRNHLAPPPRALRVIDVKKRNLTHTRVYSLYSFELRVLGWGGGGGTLVRSTYKQRGQTSMAYISKVL